MGLDSLVLDLVGILTIVLTFSKSMEKFIEKYKWTLSILISVVIIIEVWFCLNSERLADELYSTWFRLWYQAPDPSKFIEGEATYNATPTWSVLCPALIVIWTGYEFFSSFKRAIGQDKVSIANWIVGLITCIILVVHAIYHVMVVKDSFAVYMRNTSFWIAIICYNIFAVSKWIYEIHKKLQHIISPKEINKSSSECTNEDSESI
jgi:uncharacterized membrane protein